MSNTTTNKLTGTIANVLAIRPGILAKDSTALVPVPEKGAAPKRMTLRGRRAGIRAMFTKLSVQKQEAS